MQYKIIRGRFVVPMSEKLGLETRIADGYVLIKGDRIEEVGKYTIEKNSEIMLKYGSEVEIIGGSGDFLTNDQEVPQIDGLILPGFVKAHGHDHESAIIGIAKDVPLTTWLDEAVNLYTGFLHSHEEQLTKELGVSPYELSYLKARIDDLQHGITTALVHHCNFNKYHVDELVRANEKAGTKIIIAVGSQDRHYDPRILDKPVSVAIERLDNCHEKYKENKNVKIIPGPDQFFSNGPELLKSLKKWANEHETLIHIHSSEEHATTQWFKKEYGMTPVEYGYEIGFLDEKTFVGHQVHNIDHDLELLAETKTKVVHNPLANTILGSGMPPLQKFKKMGIEFAIATDGSGSADNQNIINAARVAAQYQKAYHHDATLMTAQDVLERITIVPSKILGFETGSLEPGKIADVIVLDLSVPNLTPTREDNVIENLIWAANGNEIKYVISNGEVVVNNYKFTKVNTGEVLSKIQKLSEIFYKYKKQTTAQKATGVRDSSS
ncbi:MAG: amidohydrolase family protein [Candidatus Hodarchaeales archaeon]